VRHVTNGLNQIPLVIRKPSPSPLLSSALKPVLFKGCYHLCSPEQSQQGQICAQSLRDTILLSSSGMDHPKNPNKCFSTHLAKIFKNLKNLLHLDLFSNQNQPCDPDSLMFLAASISLSLLYVYNICLV